MSLMNIKTKSQSGFTIVELLIVVVVIAILAAITLVSFNNITNRANASAALELASAWQKKVEAYNAENAAYPTTKAQMNSDTTKTWYMDTSILATPTSSNGKTTVQVYNCATPAGARVDYWKFDASTPAVTPIYLGAATSSSTCTPLS